MYFLIVDYYKKIYYLVISSTFSSFYFIQSNVLRYPNKQIEHKISSIFLADIQTSNNIMARNESRSAIKHPTI